MSMWQFFAALEGYQDAHNPTDKNQLSAAEEDELWEWMQSKAN